MKRRISKHVYALCIHNTIQYETQYLHLIYTRWANMGLNFCNGNWNFRSEARRLSCLHSGNGVLFVFTSLNLEFNKRWLQVYWNLVYIYILETLQNMIHIFLLTLPVLFLRLTSRGSWFWDIFTHRDVTFYLVLWMILTLY